MAKSTVAELGLTVKCPECGVDNAKTRLTCLSCKAKLFRQNPLKDIPPKKTEEKVEPPAPKESSLTGLPIEPAKPTRKPRGPNKKTVSRHHVTMKIGATVAQCSCGWSKTYEPEATAIQVHNDIEAHKA